MPKVSVIMPVYNVEKYIHDSIQSVLNQTYRDFELILVDDGSPDKCPEICDEYAAKYSNVSVIHIENSNRAKSRDIGIQNANGEYILFVDSDDTIHADLLEKVVPEAERTDADVTIFGIHVVTTNDGVFAGEDYRNHKAAFYANRNEVEKHFVYLNENLMWNHPVDKLVKKSIITDNHIVGQSFYDGVCEDTMFFLDLFPYVNSICVVEGCFYEYAIRNTQSTVAQYIPNRYEMLYGRFIRTKELMDSLKPEYQSNELLFELYCTFIVWAYEFLFHRDCGLSSVQRYHYIRSTFSIRSEKQEFCHKAEKYYINTDSYRNASGTTKKVLHHVLHKQYFMAWIYHMLALKRNK